MQNNEFQTLSQGYYAKLLIYFDLGSGQIRRIRVIYEFAQNVILSYVNHMFISISHFL